MGEGGIGVQDPAAPNEVLAYVPAHDVVGLDVGSQIGEMPSFQRIAPVADELQNAHLGGAHLTLYRKAKMLLDAAVVADGQLPQALIDLIREPRQAQWWHFTSCQAISLCHRDSGNAPPQTPQQPPRMQAAPEGWRL